MMECQTGLLLVAICCCFTSGTGENQLEIDALSRMNVTQVIQHYHYPVETHRVITDDGYILKIIRMPHGRNNGNSTNRTPVLLIHGLMSSASDFVMCGPEKSLGFLLADAGYDVWLGNVRGNGYSRDHVSLNPDKDKKFWNFSWHEIGIIDLPVMIDHVLSTTKHEKLFYIGHSQGTTVYYVLLSERPAYNDRILAQYSMAPIAFMKHVHGNLVKLVSTIYEIVSAGAAFFHIYEVNSSTIFIKQIIDDCRISTNKERCLKTLFSIIGPDYEQFNKSMIPIWLYGYPTSSSFKQMKHYMQLQRSGEFRQYDYGLMQNKIIYNNYSPPKYHLENIKAPIFLIYSENDYFSSVQDVRKLYESLHDGNKYMVKVNYTKWNHLDHLMATDLNKYLNNWILSSMKSFIGITLF